MKKKILNIVALATISCSAINSIATSDSKLEMVKKLLSDDSITISVKKKFFEDKDTSVLDIHVTTKDGKVTLTGSANNMNAIEKATLLAKSTDGVHEVVSQIKVAKSDSATSNVASDLAITTYIKLGLLKDKDLSILDIHVTTVNGTVTLEGIVADVDQSEKAILIAKSAKGVKEVNSKLHITK